MTELTVTWWGHSSATVELADIRVATDPLLVDRLWHLRRDGPTPAPRAVDVDLVLVSHLHADHLHVPSLRRMRAGAPVVVPRGTPTTLRRRLCGPVHEVVPGDVLDIAGVRVEVLEAYHDGRRTPAARTRAPALGFRVDDGSRSFWFPGDTGLRDTMRLVDPVDLALVPVGGWGPTLGDHHLDPDQAVTAAERVGAVWSVPVHWGTFWPIGLRAVNRANHRRLFVTPGDRFAEAARREGVSTTPLLLTPGERTVLPGGDHT